MDNENKNDALNVSEEINRADTERAAAFQYHSSLSPDPPSYPPVQGGGSALKRQRNIRLFITVILALAVLAFISGIIWLIASFKLSFKSEDGGFSIRVLRKGQESGFTDLPSETAVPTQRPDTQNPQPDEHSWNGSTINLEKPDENTQHMDFKEIYKSMSGSVVSVTSVYGSNELKATGTVISEDGLILTVCSAVISSDAVNVGHNGESYAASIVGLDYAADVAVIKIRAAGLKAAVFGSSEQAAAGDAACVVGNPVEGTMNLFSGLLSAVNKDFTYRGYPIGILQVNMSLGSGASGSPLINEFGQVIGIIDMAIAAQYPEAGSICYALPISNIKSVIDDLLHYGYVPGRPVSGLAVSDLPPALAAFYKLPNGVVITDVRQDSTAYAAGVRRNDVVFEANGVKIESSSDLMAVINGMKAGDELTLGLYREGEKGYISFKLMEANAEVG